MECPEFRQLLLLLREDLEEDLIPRRTKIHELIIKAWREYFEVLRSDVAVRTSALYQVYRLLLTSHRIRLAGSRSRQTYGRINVSDLT